MATKTDWILIAACVVLVLVCVITSLIALNCWADDKKQCAQVSGFTALLTTCIMSFIICCFYVMMTKRPKVGAAPAASL